MVYVDLDGVLANLYDYMTLRLFQKTYKNTDENQKNILKQVFRDQSLFTRFFPEGAKYMFRYLDPFPFNETLIRTVVDIAGEYTILSRPCNLDIKGTKQSKIEWVTENLSFCPPKDVLLVQDKSANGRSKNNILIDDWDKFLGRWSSKGGLSIKYQACDFNTRIDVERYIAQSLSKCFINKDY